MNTRLFSVFLATVATITASGARTDVGTLRYAGPFVMSRPAMIDSIDLNSKKFTASSQLSVPMSLSAPATSEFKSGDALPTSDGDALHLLSFTLDNERYLKGSLKVDGLKHMEIYIDGKKTDGKDIELHPATHTVTIKALTLKDETPNKVNVSFDTDSKNAYTINSASGRRLTLKDIIGGKRIESVSISPSGKYVLTAISFTNEGGSQSNQYVVSDQATGRRIFTTTERPAWMPASDRLYYVRKRDSRLEMSVADPATGIETVVAENVPSSYFTVSPTEDFLIYTNLQRGPKEKRPDVYEIINPEDRQPGWRDRRRIMKFDLATGLSTPLTFGYRNATPAGMSADGSKLLYIVKDTRMGKRPTQLKSLYLLDLNTGENRCLIENDGFIGGAAISPDGKQVAVKASPEGLGGVGNILPEGKTPSTYDYQIIILDVASGEKTPLTRDFNPCVDQLVWNTDGNIYFTAKDRDLMGLFKVDPKTKKITDLKAPEENVLGVSVASAAPAAVWFGQGASNTDRIYSLNTKNLRHRLLYDMSAEVLDGVQLGKVEGWDYVSSRGDTINARFILPPDFDPNKKYPLIVNYYGGCNPTTRAFNTRYPHQLFAANGYVVLVINPSGCTGFGQEHSSRHVNTAGEGVAQDIIDGVTQFTKAHPWIDAAKIGCIGASYGGFMTQYLQTQTPIFATAISHAGISDHTSYWGEGYWGYSYSEVSMANSYPWSEQDLYVKQSPLYNADKIHTPILFLHGDGDTNVPVGESIQMYTALKLLGRNPAFVAVKGANHQVTDYNKRVQWDETIMAWFAKYLQDNPEWWESLYPAKNL